MTDRELLELAAKAAGIKLADVSDDGVWAFYYSDEHKGHIDWNPLKNDGDALRLAVKLGLIVEIGYAARGFLVVRTNTDNWLEFREAWGDDPYAATRRAIVRAAAEIGKEMK